MLLMNDGPATNLNDLFKTLRPEPLISAEEFKQFYRPQINAVRGEDTVLVLSDLLEQSYQTVPYRAFLMGHAGVGKSTEISRLLERVKDQQIGVRLSVATELNPASFKVFDVLKLMMIRIIEEAEKHGARPHLSAGMFSKIEALFNDEQVKTIDQSSASASAEAGVGVSEHSLWGKLLNVFLSTKAALRIGVERKIEVTEHRLRRLPELAEACNELIDACSQSLFDKEKKEWILIVEDLEKMGISAQQLQELFIQYGSIFQTLRVNLLVTIPIWLGYSDEAARLPLDKHMLFDTPIFKQDHTPHYEGRKAVQQVLEARVSPTLLAEGQMDRLIVASGGNLRDLFLLTQDAGGSARRREKAKVEEEDVTKAINKMRRDYRMRLGSGPFDLKPISAEEKSKQLLAVYNDEDGHDTPNAVLYALLRASALQEFNGTCWFGVHPIVVDIMKNNIRCLKPNDPGGSS